MTLEDPFYVVKDEVFKALNKTRGLYLRWQEIYKAPTAPHCPEAEWTSTELKNALRSIEWDLEDLEDTITRIVEKYPSKFKLDNKEISDRRRFIDNVKSEVKMMKGRLSGGRGREREREAYESPRETLLPLLADESPAEGEEGVGAGAGAAHRLPASPLLTKWNKTYTRCPGNNTTGYIDSPTKLMAGTGAGSEGGGAQQRMLGFQDEQLEGISRSARHLSAVSRHIGRELDDHVLMLDDINSEMENVDSKLDSSMRQVARVLRVNNSRRQWIIIGCLAGLVSLVLILFIVL